MDREEFAVAAGLAERLCRLITTRAAEVGFSDGLIEAVIHQGYVKRVHVDFFDVSDDEVSQAGVSDAERASQRAAVTLPPISHAEARRRLKQTVREGLKGCIIPYGSVAFLFVRGRLFKVTTTEGFLVATETARLGRIFLPPPAVPASGQCLCSSPGAGNGKYC
jgi:hypothetical protein